MIIAQLTDTHLKASGRLAYQKVDTAGCLRRSVQAINGFLPKVDAVFFTGDLTDKGDPAEYEALREILAELEAPYYLLMGNHDRRDTLRAAFSDQSYLHQSQEFIQYVVDDYPVRLIALDTTLPGKPYGQLCPARLRWLDQVLKDVPDKPTMLFQHHPPFKVGIDHMDVQNLQNAADLFEALAPYKQVKHIACGHVHRDVFTQINGIGISIAPNSAHSVTLNLMPHGPSDFMMEPPSVRLFRIDEEAHITSHLHFIGAFEGPYPFYEPDGGLVD